MCAPGPQLSAADAEARIRAANEPYKLEILQSILQRDPNATITIYHIGDPAAAAAAPPPEGKAPPKPWWDLCAGPHVERTGDINPDAVDLESLAGGRQKGYPGGAGADEQRGREAGRAVRVPGSTRCVGVAACAG